MKQAGWFVSLVGALALAWVGVEMWDINPPAWLGLSSGKTLVILAAVVLVGLLVTALGARSAAASRRSRIP